MESGGFPGLQNQCDLTMSGRVGSIPIHSRHSLRRPTLEVVRVLSDLLRIQLHIVLKPFHRAMKMAQDLLRHGCSPAPRLEQER